MGRYFYSKKSTVEDYLSIHASKLNKWGYFSGYRCGSLTWSRNGEQTASIGISVSIESATHGTMRLNYTHTNRFSNEKTDLNYTVDLVSTPCNYGGARWWFFCPLSRGGFSCNRRVGVLYLGKYAGCRYCYNLTYTSCQDCHKFDRLAWSMGLPNAKALERAMKEW